MLVLKQKIRVSFGHPQKVRGPCPLSLVFVLSLSLSCDVSELYHTHVACRLGSRLCKERWKSLGAKHVFDVSFMFSFSSAPNTTNLCILMFMFALSRTHVVFSFPVQSPSKPTRHRSMHNLFSAQAQAQAHAHMHARMSPYSQYPAPGAGMFYGNAPRQSYGSNSSLNTAAASAGNAPMPPPLTRQHSLPAMQMQGAGYAPFDGFGDFVPYNHMGMQGYQGA